MQMKCQDCDLFYKLKLIFYKLLKFSILQILFYYLIFVRLCAEKRET
jgi:hypothetical protein